MQTSFRPPDVVICYLRSTNTDATSPPPLAVALVDRDVLVYNDNDKLLDILGPLSRCSRSERAAARAARSTWLTFADEALPAAVVAAELTKECEPQPFPVLHTYLQMNGRSCTIVPLLYKSSSPIQTHYLCTCTTLTSRRCKLHHLLVKVLHVHR
eukprot:jgi/Chlat1/7219/Chrsp57S06760